MKKCPECEVEISQRKKGACPECGELLFLSNGVYMRESDKKLSTKMVEKLESHIMQRDGVGVNWALERKIAYQMIDIARDALRKIRESFSLEFFVMGTLDLMLKGWWANKVQSFTMLKNHFITYARDFYKEQKRKDAETAKQTARANVSQGFSVSGAYTAI